MPMKLIAFAFLAALCTSAYSEECAQPTPQTNDAVTVTADADPASGMYHVRAPREFDGKELRLLILSATPRGAAKGQEITLPLAIKVKGELTGSYFHMPTNWLNVRVEASYGDDLCTGLVGRLSM